MSATQQIVSLVKTVLFFSIVGSALYGVFYWLLLTAVEIYIGKFEWGSLFAVIIAPAFSEVFFWISFADLDLSRAFALPTVFAAILFWPLHKRYLLSPKQIPKVWFVLLRSLTGLTAYLIAWLVINPAFINSGWDGFYFLDQQSINFKRDYAEWGSFEGYGPLFYLAISGLTGLSVGGIFGAYSLRTKFKHSLPLFNLGKI